MEVNQPVSSIASHSGGAVGLVILSLHPVNKLPGGQRPAGRACILHMDTHLAVVQCCTSPMQMIKYHAGRTVGG